MLHAVLIMLQILNFAYLQSKTVAFLEVLFTTLFQNQYKRAAKVNGDGDKLVVDTFAKARDAPQMLAGLQFFLRTHVRKSSLATSTEQQRALKASCRTAIDTLILVTSAGRPA
jgi:nucleolar MIF4G domain-containing protein 1